MSGSNQIVIVGGGASGIATAASLKKRRADLDICIIEPADKHYYQPGWTMVGGGVFKKEETVRSMDSVIPAGVKRIKAAVSEFDPGNNRVKLDNGEFVEYSYLVVASGLKLDWDAIEGLNETLGKNGVTSNYRYDLAPYTWQLVNETKSGEAIFTQPPMPIKCAGAPQKAMYLSCDAWLRKNVLNQVKVSFCNAGPALFGVAAYVPPLMEYVNKYGINLQFTYNLKKVDGAAKKAWFEVKGPDDKVQMVERSFDMLHVVPPQTAPDFIKSSPLAGAGGWVDVNQESLRHNKFDNIFSLGDVCSAPNAKTAAAARKQAPIVAENLLSVMDGKAPACVYDGYGSCPLTVENGKIILAEFGYGGKLLPSFNWDSTKPRRSAWFLKKSILPWLYWNAMLKGREWLANPLNHS